MSSPHVPHPPLRRAVAWALRRRCPRCGGGPIFRGWLRLAEECPSCRLHFERVEGYWLGSMVINIGVTQAVLLGALVGILVLTWPDVPWTALIVLLVGIAVVVPLVFHPLGRTLWIAGERHVHVKAHPDAAD